MASARARVADGAATPFEPDAVLAPLPDPGQMLFCGLTHRALRDDLGGGERLTDHPYVYAKLQHTIIGPGEPIVIPTETTDACWEVELGVIIGRDARNVSVEQAVEHVFGYTVINDVTALDEMRDSMFVLTDELPDAGQAGQRTIVNGVVRQDGSMADCWFTVSEIVSWLSSRFTLRAGDLISTGTPPGIAGMAPGDEVVCEIDGVGRLVNPVVAGWQS